MKSRKHSHVPPVSRKREPGGKAVRMSEIMRLFYKYGVDAIPVLDKKGKLQGLLDKKLVLHDADDAQSIDKPFYKSVDKYLLSPGEAEFLSLVSGLPDESRFPVIDRKGQFLLLWDKKKMLTGYYSRKDSPAADPDNFFREILNKLPFSFLVTDIRHRIIFASEHFLREFEFDADILLEQDLFRLFPAVSRIQLKDHFYPRQHTISYRHKDWYYTVLRVSAGQVYLFARDKEKFKPDREPAFPQDLVEVGSFREAAEKPGNRQDRGQDRGADPGAHRDDRPG